MIQPIQPSDLDRCAEVIRESFATVAKDFNLTPENAPTNPAFLPVEKLKEAYEKGTEMFALWEEGEIVGFCALEKAPGDGCAYYLERLAVLPGCRHKGYGLALLNFCRRRVYELGGKKIQIGIIEENSILKNWYAAHGFVPTGTKKFEHLPFTVGFMEMGV